MTVTFKAESPTLYILTFLLAFAVLLFDLALPLGVAAGVPYVALVLLGLRARWNCYIFILAAVATVLTITGYLFSLPGGAQWVVLVNRSLALFAIWVTAALIHRHRGMAVLAGQAEALERQVAGRTKELEEKSALLQTTLENMGHAFCVYDADHEVAAYNKQYLHMARLPEGLDPMGLSYEQILRYRMNQGVFGEEELQRRLKSIKDNRESKVQERVHPDGTVFIYQRKPMPDGGFVVTYTDITDRKRAEQEAAEKTALLETTLENMGQGFYVFDADFRLVAFNQQYLDTVGFPPGFIRLGMTYEEIVRFRGERGDCGDGSESVDEIVDRRDRSIKAREEREGEFTNPDGRIFSFHRKPMPNGGFVATYTDITEHKKTTQALAKKSALLLTSLENMGHGFCVFDADHKVAAYNKQYLHMACLPSGLAPMGLSYEQMLRRRMNQGVFGEEEMQRRLQAIKDNRESKVQEHVHPDGTVFIYQRKPMPDGGFVIIYTDITARKKAEVALEEKTALLETTFENMSQGFAVFDADLKLVAYNQHFLDLSFFPPGFIHIGTAWEDVLRVYAEQRPRGPGGEEEFVRERMKRVREGKPIRHSEQPAPNGKHVKLDRNPMPDGGFVITYTDITQRKRAEDEVRNLNEALEQKVEDRTEELQAAQGELLKSERLATLGRLTATVSHELRNPLGAIRTSFYLVRNTLKDPDPRLKRAADRVERGITRCNRIIEELLDFTRGRELKLSVTPIDDWVTELLDEQAVPEGVRLIRDLAAPGVSVALDRERLRRAVINLYDNACQAMSGEGANGVDVTQRELTIRTGVKADRVEICFKDTGPGIPEDVLPKIFEPLFSTKGFGVGLGLSVVKQIADQHGGGIAVTTEDGHGTEVRLWLPLAPQAAQTATPEAEQPAA